MVGRAPPLQLFTMASGGDEGIFRSGVDGTPKTKEVFCLLFLWFYAFVFCFCCFSLST